MRTGLKYAARFSVIPAAAVLALGLGGCSALSGIFGQSAARDADSQEITAPGSADVFTLRVGDCFDDNSETEISDVPGVPCANPHDNEVYYTFQMPEGDYPGKAAITAAAEEGCVPQFESFIGISYSDSKLDWFPLTPLEDGWNSLNDREIVCAAYDPDGKVTGSLAGVAR